MSLELRPKKTGGASQPSLLRVLLTCLLPVVALFVGYEVVERRWLGAVGPDVLHFLHIVRGFSAATVAAALATLVLLRQLHGPTVDETPLPTHARPWQRRLQHARMRTKIVVPMVVLAVGPALLVGLFTIASSRTSLRETARDRVRFHAAAKATAVRDFLLVVQHDLRFLAQREVIRALAGATASTRPDELADFRREAEDELLIFSEGKQAYYQVRYIDGDGREVVRINRDGGQTESVPPQRLQDKSDRYYVKEALALAPGRIYVSPLDLNIEYGQLEVPYRGVVRYATPVAGRNGRGRGLVVINLYADYIMSLLGPLPAGAEAWLVDQDGTYLGYVGESDEMRNVYELKDQRRLSMDYSQDAVAAILSSEVGGSVLETAHAFVSAEPITSDVEMAKQRWSLLIAYPRKSIDLPIRQLTVVLSAATILALVVAGVLGVLVGTYIARPIGRLRRATREIAAGDLSRRVDIATGDELEALAFDFNVMTERLHDAQERLSTWNEQLEGEVARQTDQLHQQQVALARADKMASIGMMTAGVMHEVGNPLAAIKTKIQVAEEQGVLCKNCHRILSEILTEVDRLAVFLRAFSRLAKPREVRLDKVSLAEVIQGVMSLITPELRRRGLRLRVELAPDTPAICGDGEQLRQLLINLILNAADASRSDGEIIVRAGRAPAEPEEVNRPPGVAVEVEDEGSGIAPEDLERIWDPFFTTKSDGTGLGLSICRKIVADHGGTVQIRSELGLGTLVALTLSEWDIRAQRAATGR